MPVRPAPSGPLDRRTGHARRVGALALTAALLSGLAGVGAAQAAPSPATAVSPSAVSPSAVTGAAVTPSTSTATGTPDPAVLAGSESPAVVSGDDGAPLSAAAQRLAGQRLLAGAGGWTPVATRGVPTPRPEVAPPAALDGQPSYVPQKTCQNVAQPGLVRLRTLLETTYPGTSSYGINIVCDGRSHVSEHLEGRAFDWKVAKAVPAQKVQAETFLSWLTANDGVMARRLGIMYVMWDGRIWGAYAPQSGWRTSTCSGATDCHRDHVHISMSWDGAYARTSFWTGRAVTVNDLGPCVAPGEFFALPYSTSRRNTQACATWKPLLPDDLTFVYLRRDARRNVSLREHGTAVLVLTRILGGEPRSRVSTVRTGQQLASFQARRGIPVTGTITPATWQQLALFSSGGAVRVS